MTDNPLISPRAEIPMSNNQTTIQPGDWVAARDTSGEIWGGIVKSITPFGVRLSDMGVEFLSENVRPRHRRSELEQTPRDRFHTLKTWPPYWDDANEGRKPFKVRRADRDYQVGDILLLQRWEPERDDYTRDESGHPATIARRVIYVLTGGKFGIERGFVVMGVQNVQ